MAPRSSEASGFSGTSRRGLAAAAVGVAFLAGCGGDRQLPVDAELTVSPQSRTIEIGQTLDAQGRCEFDPNRFVDLPVVMRLRAGNGSPLGDVSVSVYVDWSGNTYSGYPALALYEDRNGNGVVDADSELASGRDDDIARVRTDDETGAHAAIVRVNVSCPYRGELFAFTGGVTAQASFEVVATETIETAPAPAPALAPGSIPALEAPAPDAPDGDAADAPADATPADAEPADAAPDPDEAPDGAPGDVPAEGDNPFEPVPVSGDDATDAPADPATEAPRPVPCIERKTLATTVTCSVPAVAP